MLQSQLQQFHNELKAAIAAGVPLGRPAWTSRQLDGFESSISRQTNSEQSEGSLDPHVLEEAIGKIPNLPSSYVAAWKTYCRTKSISPVLDGLTVESVGMKELNRLVRGSVFYVGLVLAIALIGICFFVLNVLPVMTAIRMDPGRSAYRQVGEVFDSGPLLWAGAGVVGIVLLFLSIWLLMERTSWIAYWCGGNQFLRFKLAGQSMRILRCLADSGMPISDAVSVACDLTNADSVVRNDIEASVSQVSSIANSSDPNSPSQPGNSQKLNNSHSLEETAKLASYFSLLAGRRLTYLKVSTPTLMVLCIGGVVALLYCLAVFTPIISLMVDLVRAGEVQQ
ncbi:MAG: hypothetical protein AB8B55_00710 [Mariniblastus sp.]